MRLAIALLVSAAAVSAAPAGELESSARLHSAATVLREIMATPDKAIPEGLLARAHCVVVVPGMKKGAFIIGARYGKGCMTCRRKDGKSWSAPGTVRIEGGSLGFQFGGSESDVVLLVMNERGAERLLESKFTLGADATVAAGPVGREAKAETDALMTAEILSWSRSRGVFAGVALGGATLRQDLADNRELYGRTLENREIITGDIAVPEAARELIALLEGYSPAEKR